jgi:hypothetical protein
VVNISYPFSEEESVLKRISLSFLVIILQVMNERIRGFNVGLLLREEEGVIGALHLARIAT